MSDRTSGAAQSSSSPHPLSLPSEVKVRGHLVRGVFRWMKQHGMESLRDDVVDRTPPSVRDSLRQVVLATDWYPYETWTSLLRSLDQVAGSGDLELLPTVGRDALDADLNGLLRLLVVFLNPDSMIDRGFLVWGQSYWNRLFDHGTISIASRSVGHAAMRLVEFPTPDAAHCRFMTGYFERGFERVGAAEMVVTHPTCAAVGDAECIYSGSWRPGA